MVDKERLQEASITFLIGIIMIGIAMFFGLTMGVQLQQYVTASSGNFTGLSLFVVQNLVLFLLLIVLAFGAGFIYRAYKMATE